MHTWLLNSLTYGGPRKIRFKHLYCPRIRMSTSPILWPFSNWFYATPTDRGMVLLVAIKPSGSATWLWVITLSTKVSFANSYATRSTAKFAIKRGVMRIRKPLRVAGCLWPTVCRLSHRRQSSTNICSSKKTYPSANFNQCPRTTFHISHSMT